MCGDGAFCDGDTCDTVAGTCRNKGNACTMDSDCPRCALHQSPTCLRCKGSGIGYTLNEAMQGSVAAKLSLGSSGPLPAQSYCLDFAPPAVEKDEPNALKAKGAPAADGCPVL